MREVVHFERFADTFLVLGEDGASATDAGVVD
jgi:hypothetical protein